MGFLKRWFRGTDVEREDKIRVNELTSNPEYARAAQQLYALCNSGRASDIRHFFSKNSFDSDNYLRLSVLLHELSSRNFRAAGEAYHQLVQGAAFWRQEIGGRFAVSDGQLKNELIQLLSREMPTLCFVTGIWVANICRDPGYADTLYRAINKDFTVHTYSMEISQVLIPHWFVHTLNRIRRDNHKRHIVFIPPFANPAFLLLADDASQGNARSVAPTFSKICTVHAGVTTYDNLLSSWLWCQSSSDQNCSFHHIVDVRGSLYTDQMVARSLLAQESGDKGRIRDALLLNAKEIFDWYCFADKGTRYVGTPQSLIMTASAVVDLWKENYAAAATALDPLESDQQAASAVLCFSRAHLSDRATQSLENLRAKNPSMCDQIGQMMS